MTRIYTRTSWVAPWHMAMVVGSGVNTDHLVNELKQSGLRVFVFHEPVQRVKKPKG